MDMAAERSRDGLTGVRDEENRLGWPPIASALENESVSPWRLLGGPVCASLPNGSESIPEQCCGSAALSPPQASPSDDREGHEMSGCRPAQRRLGRSRRARSPRDRLSDGGRLS